MTTKRTINWGILGCGKIARKFALDLSLSDGRLYACASSNPERAKAFASEFGASEWFDNYESLVKCIEIDVIYIATPHSFHHDHSILCIQHGKHVLCEKPIAINVSQLENMMIVSRQNNVFLMEAMWTAFLPAIIDLQKKVVSGAIGQIRHLSADFGFQTVYNPKSRLFDPALAGGSLLDVGIYPLFIALLLMGVPESIEAKATIAPTGVDSDCTVLLSYTNGATASLYSSIACHTDTKCEIYGTEGKITIPGRFHEQDHYFLKKDDHEKQIHCSKTGLGYWHETNHVIECLLSSKKESDIIPLDFSLKMIKMMDEIREIIGVKYAT